MKKHLVFILLNFTTLILCAQLSNTSEKIIKELDLRLTIERQQPADILYLNINDLKDNRLIKSIEIDNDIDSYIIDTYFCGDRNFAILDGRYKFFIIDLSTNILIGPFRATPRGTIADAQSLVIGYFNIIQNGQYLIFASIDFGVYCYNLTDLYNPIETNMYTKKTAGLKEIFFFLDKREKNIYNGIVSLYEIEKGNIYSRKITSKLLFQDYTFKTDTNDSIVKEQIDDRYLVLYRLNPSEKEDVIIVDYEQGKILDTITDKELILHLTKQ